MDVPKIIGLNGVAGSGKDTVSSMIIEEHNYTQVSFAEPLKDVISVLFGWDRDMIEGRTQESRQWRDIPDPYWSKVLGKSFSPREALQNVGTDLFRCCFNENIWIASLQKRIQEKYQNEKLIFSDCRFLNEIQMVRDLGGAIIEVRPKERPYWYDDAICKNKNIIDLSEFSRKNPDIHESEHSWVGVNQPDYIIHNSGTLSDLRVKVLKLFQ